LADPAFGLAEEEMAGLLHAERFTGRAKEQTDEFLAQVRPVLEANGELLGLEVKITI